MCKGTSTLMIFSRSGLHERTACPLYYCLTGPLLQSGSVQGVHFWVIFQIVRPYYAQDAIVQEIRSGQYSGQTTLDRCVTMVISRNSEWKWHCMDVLPVEKCDPSGYVAKNQHNTCWLSSAHRNWQWPVLYVLQNRNDETLIPHHLSEHRGLFLLKIIPPKKIFSMQTLKKSVRYLPLQRYLFSISGDEFFLPKKCEFSKIFCSQS